MSKYIKMPFAQTLLSIRQKFIDYPDYFLWFARKRARLFYILFGFSIMLVTFTIHSWFRKIEQRNKHIYIEVYTDTITTLHPLIQSDHILDKSIQKLLYLPLIRINASTKFSRVLLDSFSVSNIYKNYIINIKKGIKWNNNEDITTQDVAFTYNFIKSYYPDTPLGKALSTANIKILNNYSIRFILKNPYVGFIRQLTYPIANKKLYNKQSIDALIQNPYSLELAISGPYKLENITIDSVTLKPRINTKFKIIWKYQRTPQTAYFEFISNKADAYVITDNNYELQKRLKNNPNVILTKYPLIFEIKGIFINMATKNQYLKNIKYRRALLKLLAPTFFANHFGYLPAYSIYPKQTDFFNDQLISNRKLTRQELSSIRNIVQNSSFKLAFLDNPSEAQIANFIQQYLKKYNINVILSPINIEDFEYEILQVHNFDALLYGIKINADPDQSAFWHSKGNQNIVSLKNPVVDKLLQKGLTTYNLIQRGYIYKQLQQEVVYKNVAFIPLFHPNLYVGYNKSVKKLGINTQSAELTDPANRVLLAYPFVNAKESNTKGPNVNEQ